jgi:hypothetical protein
MVGIMAIEDIIQYSVIAAIVLSFFIYFIKKIFDTFSK